MLMQEVVKHVKPFDLAYLDYGQEPRLRWQRLSFLKENRLVQIWAWTIV